MKGSHFETWLEFGDRLTEYITSNMCDLEENSYDIIITFSRGGTILGFTFACLLRDNSAIYSSPYKGSVRSIPSGINIKIDNPCFIMDHPASQQEKEDIKNNLKRELEYFSEEYNEGKELRILIMDDNLTGATRIKFLDRMLSKIKSEIPDLIKFHHSLAYVRHKSFRQDIPTVRDFPKTADYFIMPWHNPSSLHTAKELPLRDNIPVLENLIFYIKLNCDYDTFVSAVEARCGIDYEFHYWGGICNGASNFVINGTNKDAPEFVEILHVSHMVYPPKVCLTPSGSKRGEVPHTENFRPLCECFKGDNNYIAIDLCNTCICLNCNKKLITNVLLPAADSKEISLKPNYKEGLNNGDLTKAIDRWFEKWLSSAFWI